MSIPPSATARQSRNCSLCDVPYELGEVYQLVYAFIRKGGKLPDFLRYHPTNNLAALRSI